jgi:putative hemolysin
MASFDSGQECGIEPLHFNNFLVRLAEGAAEIDAAQALRYRVFYEEMTAAPTPEMKARNRDFDGFDEICDHLLAIDQEAGEGGSQVVGTYRLLRRSVAVRHGGFYTEQEYDLSRLLRHPGEIVELGRSCVDPAYRSRGVMQLLWRGLAAYILHYDIDLMFGCASFPGTEPEAMGTALSYLHYYHLAPRAFRPRALPHHYVDMGRLPRAGIDVQSVVNELPPLIKGYLRLGGFVGDGAVVDHQFNTTDVCMIVKTDQVTKKYDRHYRRAGGDRAET